MTTFSFELFPPRTPEALTALDTTIEQLGSAGPSFVSVTYGAGGSDRRHSFAAIRAVTAAGLPVAGHLTCVGQSRTDVDSVVARFRALGVTRIVALRGDAPGGAGAAYAAHPSGYQRTCDLVAAVVAGGGFDVAVSAYPERHPDSPSIEHDLDVLAAKVAAGADRAITQMFFDNELFLRFRERVAARGIDVALVPGIFPIHSFPAVARFAARCGATIPDSVAERFAGLDADPIATEAVAATVAAEQVAELVSEGVEHVHLYTLNRARLVLAVQAQLFQSVSS
jgi:methylenetetrahydrofolate reductase (NADPH)